MNYNNELANVVTINKLVQNVANLYTVPCDCSDSLLFINKTGIAMIKIKEKATNSNESI